MRKWFLDILNSLLNMAKFLQDPNYLDILNNLRLTL